MGNQLKVIKSIKMSRIAQIKRKNINSFPLKWMILFLFFGHLTLNVPAGIPTTSAFVTDQLKEEGAAFFGVNRKEQINLLQLVRTLDGISYKEVFLGTDTGQLPKTDTSKRRDSLTGGQTAIAFDVKDAVQLDSSHVLQNKEEKSFQFEGTGKIQEGVASWYSDKFNGRKTANGERFDQKKMTAAHNKLPFGTWVKVTNLRNKKVVFVRINDRLHYKNKRVIDLTRAAAAQLGMIQSGLARVRVEVVKKKDIPHN